MWISHRKEIRKLTFRAQALRRIRSDEGLALETSAFESLLLRWLIHIINPVDKTKLSCNTPTDAAPQFLYNFVFVWKVIEIPFLDIFFRRDK